jgi:hypothetical protein
MPGEARAQAGWRPRGALPHVAAWLVLAAVWALLLAQSWERWGDLLVDLGRDCTVPGEILRGRVLYRDVVYSYGPVAPYLLAGVEALFGDRLRVFAAVGLLSGAGVAAGLYALGWQFGGLGAAIASALLFLVLNFFAASTWGCNFVLPYSHAAVLGAFFAVWSTVFLLRYLFAGRRRRDGALAAVFLLLALFTKQDVGLAALAVHLAAWWAHRLAARGALAVLGSGAVLAAAAAALFGARAPGDHALLGENLARFGGGVLSGAFFRSVSGIDDWRGNLAAQGLALAGPVLVLLAVNALALTLRRDRGRTARWFAAAAACAALLPLLLLASLRGSFGDVRALGPVVWAAAAAVLLLAVRDRRDPLLLLGVFVLGSAVRIPLAYHPLWYGFSLCVPAYPFLAFGLGVRLPTLLPAPRATRAAAALLGLFVLARFEGETRAVHRAMTDTLVTEKGVMRDLPSGRAAAIGSFLEHLRTRAAGDATLVVFPEGATLNYFSGLRNPTAYSLFTPPELDAPPGTEARMLGELERARPRYVAVVSRDLAEFGYVGFGADSGLLLARWIRDGYRTERVFDGGAPVPFRITLLARADAQAPPR